MDKNDIFLTAIKENQRLIYKIASIYTNSIEDRNDLAQEIIYQLWRSFDSFDQKASLSTWMYRVSMNVAIHHLKMEKRRFFTTPLKDTVLEFSDDYNPEVEEKWQVIKQHIDNLNLLDKGIVLLYLENKSHDEIAQIIGISKSNVGTKLSRIKEKLKQQILKK